MKQSEKTAITKEKILNAAEMEFAKCGLAAARVDVIAKEAGVNKQLIYAHFESKENLYAVVLEKVYARVSEYESTIAKSEFKGTDTARMIVMEYFNFLMNNPTFVRLLLWENLNNAVYLNNVHTNLFSGAENLLKKGVEEGVFRKDLDIKQTAISLNLFCFSAFSNVHTVSKILGEDYNVETELRKRADHIADVLTKYTLYRDDNPKC